MKADARCRSCQAPIRWVITKANGRRMPLDPEPVADGNVFVIGTQDGMPLVEVALMSEAVPASEALRYVSHFVSCPQRGEWRKAT